MAFRPLKAFGGFLDRMVPTSNYGGLLSPQDQRAAGQDMRAILASGLLSAAGPQRMPVSLGQALGGALPPAMAARDQRAEIGLRNEQMRREIERENKQNAAMGKVRGLLGAMNPESADLLGGLFDVAPGAVTQGLLGQMFGGRDDRTPNDILMMDAIGLPRTPEGLARLNELKSDPESNEMMKGLQLQIQGLQLAGMRREAEKEEQQARETRLTRENSIKRGIDQTGKIADLTKKLEGTFLAAGLPAAEWRRGGLASAAAVGGALGFDTKEIEAEINAFDQLKKNLSDQLINLMSTGSLGQGTDSKLQQYRDALASPETSPGAVMAIQAGIAETLLDQADVLQISLPDREKIEKSIEEMRNYVPGGTETIVDVPAAAEATGRAVVRAADIARMGIDKLSQLDPASMTPEMLEAAKKRWDEINNVR